MSRLRVAILEDNKELLKDLKERLEDTQLVEVVAWATGSDEFLEKVKTANPEALLLDIDLSGDSMSGLDIANKLKLPVLFVSGKIGEFYKDIEGLDEAESNIPIAHITKPVSTEKLRKRLPKFINEIKALRSSSYVVLNIFNKGREKVEVSNIVYLTSEGEDSNNKVIFFSNRHPEILVDFSFKNMGEKGLDENVFLKVSKSHRVNRNKINVYLNSHVIEVTCIDKYGKQVIAKIPVSENYRDSVRRSLK